jgi:hypothetical protein
MSLTPKNWATFQHYKDRKPPWIKLHRGLLDDYEFLRLPLASQALAPRIWLLASEYEGGKITASLEEIAFRLHKTESDLREALKPLVSSGFFHDASGMLAERKQEATPEREEETETEEETEVEKGRAVARAVQVYAFSGTVIRLTPKDFKSWEVAYPNINLMAELTARDAWLASDEATNDDRKRWFHSTAQHLANRDMKAKAMGKYEKPMSEADRIEAAALRGVEIWKPGAA